MSKAVKTIVGVVAAIAIPFVAPTIATSIGLSSAIGSAVGSATAGSVIGSALTGAALGAAKGAVLGEDIGRSALFGGIGGGVGGYMSAASAATAKAGGAVGGTGLTSSGGGIGLTAPGATAMGGGGIGLTAPGATAMGGMGLSGAMAPMDYSLTAGMQFPTMGLNPATAGVGLQSPDPGFFASSVDRALATGTPIDYSLAAGMPSSQGLSVVSTAPDGGAQVTTSQGVYTSTTPISEYSGGAYSSPQATTGKPTTLSEALSKVGSELKAKFTDPKALADMTLRAAGMLAGSALAGTGLSDEEQALLNAQVEELRRLQQTNQELFRQRLEQAQNLIGESRYFDPEYFGLQSARRVQIAGARAKRAGLRGLEGPVRQAEARRYDLATARDTGTAFDVGYGTGVSGRLQTLQAGINAMPQNYPSSLGEYNNLWNAHKYAEDRRRQTQQDIGSLFGSLTGRSQ